MLKAAEAGEISVNNVMDGAELLPSICALQAYLCTPGGQQNTCLHQPSQNTPPAYTNNHHTDYLPTSTIKKMSHLPTPTITIQNTCLKV